MGFFDVMFTILGEMTPGQKILTSLVLIGIVAAFFFLGHAMVIIFNWLRTFVQITIENLPKPIKVIIALLLFTLVGGLFYKLSFGSMYGCFADARGQVGVHSIDWPTGLALNLFPLNVQMDKTLPDVSKISFATQPIRQSGFARVRDGSGFGQPTSVAEVLFGAGNGFDVDQTAQDNDFYLKTLGGQGGDPAKLFDIPGGTDVSMCYNLADKSCVLQMGGCGSGFLGLGWGGGADRQYDAWNLKVFSYFIQKDSQKCSGISGICYPFDNGGFEVQISGFGIIGLQSCGDRKSVV